MLHIRAFCLLILCVSALVSGTAQPIDGQGDSVWTEPITIAQAPQADAPALAASADQLIAAWVGMDARGVHQDARILDMEAPEAHAALTLPLPPTHPYNQQLFPGAGGAAHLLWLDAGDNDQNNLYSALLSHDLAVERGPVSLSDGLALAYSAVPDGEGGLWVAWSGGLLSEMSLSVRRIDAEGRPLLDTTVIASAASNPALVRTAVGEIWLFWTAEGRLMRQRLDAADSTAGEATALTGAVSLAPGDRLIDVRAGLDATSAYFFWNIARVSGANETWWTAGALDAPLWRQPERLRITVDETAQVSSGFGFDVTAASAGEDTTLRLVEPTPGQFDTLAAAAESDAGLGILVLRGGEIVGYGVVVPGLRLIGVPALVVDADDKLNLAWAAPGDAAADLMWSTTCDS